MRNRRSLLCNPSIHTEMGERRRGRFLHLYIGARPPDEISGSQDRDCGVSHRLARPSMTTRWHGRETADQMLQTDRPSARQREEIFGTVSAVTAVTSIFYTNRPTDRPTPRRKLRPYRARVPTLPSINIASHCQAATRPPRTAEAVRVCCRAHTVLSIRSLRCVTFGTYLGHVATKPPETA